MVNGEGLREVTIGIAGIGISFLFDRTLSEWGVEDSKNDFITNDGTDVKLRVHHGRIPDRMPEKKIFDSGSTWSLYYNGGKYVLQDCSFEPDLLPERIVVLESDFKSGDIYMRNGVFNQNLLPDPLGHPLSQILMIMFLSSRSKGMLLHACGIDDGGNGYLFLGNSTHGKSTISRLWFENHATVLNDDRIIVRENGGDLWMYGTPWHGDFKEVSPKGLPIRKIFFLRHGEKNSAVPKRYAEATSMLLTRSFPPFWDKKGMDYTVGLCHRIVSKIPCYELNFVPDGKIISFVRNI